MEWKQMGIVRGIVGVTWRCGSHLKGLQVAHVVDQDIGVHRSQPQRMSVVPLGEVVSRKSLLADSHCHCDCDGRANWAGVCFLSAYFRKQTGKQTNKQINKQAHVSTWLSCFRFALFWHAYEKQIWNWEKSLWHLTRAHNWHKYDMNMDGNGWDALFLIAKCQSAHYKVLFAMGHHRFWLVYWFGLERPLLCYNTLKKFYPLDNLNLDTLKLILYRTYVS